MAFWLSSLEKLKIKFPKTPKQGMLFFKLSAAKCLARLVSTIVYKIIELFFSLHSLSIFAICCSVLMKTNSLVGQKCYGMVLKGKESSFLHEV